MNSHLVFSVLKINSQLVKKFIDDVIISSVSLSNYIRVNVWDEQCYLSYSYRYKTGNATTDRAIKCRPRKTNN